MKAYLIYENNLGSIYRILNLIKEKESVALANVTTGYSYVWYEGSSVDPYTQRIDPATRGVVSKSTQSITATPTSITANGTDKSVLSGIEKGSIADIIFDSDKRERTVIATTKMKFCTDEVGTHDIVISHPAYLDTTVTITATAP